MTVLGSNTNDRAKSWRIIALVLIWLAFGIRFYHLGQDSFWFDELLTVNTARQGVAAAFTLRGHPPLHYLLVSATIRLFGESEFAARLPSALAGTLAVPLLLLWGKGLKRPCSGLWAAFLLALSPFHLRYSHEARHYAWLMFFSLATYVFLDRAMARRQWRYWLIFALLTVANLFTHYAALVVLASQTIVIGGWILGKWRQQTYRILIFPGAAAFVVIALYAAWLPKLLVALDWNFGDEAGRSSQNIASWIRQVFISFGASEGLLSYLMLALVFVGLWQLIRMRRWHSLFLISGGIILPIVLIGLFKVSRWSLAKYVIYALPPYLLAIGIAVDAILERSKQYWGRHGRLAYSLGSLSFALIFMFISFPLLRDEYQYTRMDWKGIAEYLDHEAQDGDIIMPVALDMANGFNQGGFVLPYYLKQSVPVLSMLAAHKLDKSDLDRALQTDANIWVAALNRNKPVELEDASIRITPFQSSVYLLAETESSGSTLDQLINWYEQLIPVAQTPSPQCLLREDLALLFAEGEKYLTAEDMYVEAKQECPQRVNGRYGDYDLPRAIYHGLLERYQQQGDVQAARQAAFQLLALNNKDVKALETVTAVNLLRTFQDGAAQINAAPDVEPIQIRQFTMPRNGDWGNVLLIHPPNSLSYQIHLPDEPTILQFRGAMAPESWEWGGDGSTFVVSVKTDTTPSKILFHQHISNDPADRNWHAVAIPLTDFAGQTIILTLASEPGPNGDFTGDWAGWATPRIIYAE